MRAVRESDAYRNRQMRSGGRFTLAQIERMRRLVDQYGLTVAAQIMGTSTNAICVIRRRGWTVGMKGPAPKPRPTDFAIQAAHMSLHELKDHYRSSIVTVSRWAREVGRAPMRGHQQAGAAIPANAHELVETLGIKRAAMSIGCHPDTLRRRLKAIPKPDKRAGWAERRFAA